MRVGLHVEALIQDIRFSFRWLLRERAFTATALLTLALGIGSTTAVFTLVDVLLLRPLPVKSAGRTLHAVRAGSERRPHSLVLFAWVLRASPKFESHIRQPVCIVDGRVIGRQSVRWCGHRSRAVRARIRQLLRRAWRRCSRGADSGSRRRSNARVAPGRCSELRVLATPIRGSAGCRRAFGDRQRHSIYRRRRGKARFLRHDTWLRAGYLGVADDGQSGDERQHRTIGTQPELSGDDNSSRAAF